MMRGFRRVRWVYAILAFFIAALFIYAALTFYDQGATKETIVAGVIGAVFSAVGYFLVPRQQENDAA